jgi:hypothetical protein
MGVEEEEQEEVGFGGGKVRRELGVDIHAASSSTACRRRHCTFLPVHGRVSGAANGAGLSL